MSIRKASFPEDTAKIVWLIKQIELTNFPSIGEVEDSDNMWFVYVQTDSIVGCVATTESRGEIKHIAVDASCQHIGIGGQLVEAMYISPESNRQTSSVGAGACEQ